MKKQKFSLQLRKQKIAKLSEQQAQGGAAAPTTLTFTPPIPFTRFQAGCLTFQVNCKSVLINCDPLPTMPSGCGPCPTTDTYTTNIPTYITC